MSFSLYKLAYSEKLWEKSTLNSVNKRCINHLRDISYEASIMTVNSRINK